MRPAAWLERLAARALPDGAFGEGALGDLAEEFARRRTRGALSAHAWYARQVGSLWAYRIVNGGHRGRTGTDSDLLMDLRWTLRLLMKHPGFALGVVGILSVGFGSLLAVFSVVEGTFRNTSWWAEPERAVAIWPDRTFSFGHLSLYRDEATPYAALGGYTELAFALRTPDGTSQSVNGVALTPELFRALRVQPVVGRALADEDALVGVEPVVVLGYDLWQRAFGGDPEVVGSTVDLSGAGVRIVGVNGPGARAPGSRAEVWLPLVVDPRDDDYFKAQTLKLVGILRPGATLGDAMSDLVAFNDYLSRLFPMFYPPGWAEGSARVVRADEAERRLIRTPLYLLLAGSGLLLLLTALNVGNLLLGRAVERRRELAIRAAIGAGRGRIVRQLLAESGVLTLSAVAGGLLIASVAGPLVASLFVGSPMVSSAGTRSGTVLLFAAGVAGITGAVVGGIPVAHFLRVGVDGIRGQPRGGATVQRGLVSAQSALATLLLVTATLFVATVDNLKNVPVGFDASRMLAVELSPPEDRASLPGARDLYAGLVAAVDGDPAVEAVGLTASLPLRAVGPETGVNLETAPVDPAQAVRGALHRVDPGFFRVFDLEPLAGRLLEGSDRGDLPTAVVVNQTLADLLWPDGSAVGQRVAIDPHAWDRWIDVVGVVPDIKIRGVVGAPGPQLFVALAEDPAREVTVVVRLRSDADAGALPRLTRAIREAEPTVPVRSAAWMEGVVREAYSVAWVLMGLLLVLATLATALGAVGIYAVLSRHVASRRREMGVRLALGARPGTVVAAVIRSGVILAGVGILLGCVLAALATRGVESLLFGVSGVALWAYLAPAAALTLAAFLAAWFPAARAGRLPPAEALRPD